MSLPYFPFYVADYALDTQHLTLEEHGAYLRLLCLCWTTPGCTIPDDQGWIMRRLGTDEATYQRAVSPVIGEFFKREEGRLYSPRLRKEALLSEEKHRRRVEAGKLGGRPTKPLKGKASGQSNAKAMPKQPEPEPEDRLESATPSQVTARKAPSRPGKSRIPPDWRASDLGRAYARDHGLSDGQVDELEQEFVVYWTDRSRDASKSAQGWEMTWRNRVRDVAARLPRRPNPPPNGPRSKSDDRLAAWLDAARSPRDEGLARGPDRDPPQALLRG